MYEYSKLKKNIKETIKKIPYKSYKNFMKYAYTNKDVRKYIPKESNKRRIKKIYR